MKITSNFIPIFIPSYHRPNKIKTVNYFLHLGYDAEQLHVVIDSEADDQDEYKLVCKQKGVNLHVFDMNEARARYDYVHRPGPTRRSAGQARNQFYDLVKKLNINFYLVIDDDTTHYEVRPFSFYEGKAELIHIKNVFQGVKEFMQKQRIGMFGLSQTGDLFQRGLKKPLRLKVMNTTFIDTRFIYRGERGVQDNDTSQFVGVMNEGLFTGSLATGLCLSQTQSATQKGGLTELYQELKLLNKALIIPIQFPSLCYAEKQKKNGNRVHHKITYKNLMPKIIKGKRSNIAWNTYIEDVPFSNEPKNRKSYEQR